MQVIPGILEKDWNAIETKLQKIKTFTNIAHIDIIDGLFVNNKTHLDPKPFVKYSRDLYLELHMMVIDPVKILEEWADAGFRRFLGHIEHMSDQTEFIKEAKKYGEAGLALDGPTHINSIKIPFEQLDTILIYTSNRVGFSGPPLMEDRLDKIRHLRKLTHVPIEADGGINDQTIISAKSAGATRLVSTSNIWRAENPADHFRKLSESIY